MKLVLPRPGFGPLAAVLGRLKSLPGLRRKLRAEAVETAPPPAAARAAPPKPAAPNRPQVGTRRSGPGRRATDQIAARQEPAVGLDEALEALRRSRVRPPAEGQHGESAARPALDAALPSAARRYKADVRLDRGPVKPGDDEFLQGLRQAQVAEATPGALWTLYLLALIIALGLAWASVAKVDVVTRAEGKVVPDAREQVIASLEGGILRAIHVREGAIVEAGQDLVQLDPTRFAAAQNEGQARQLALKATAARLAAETYGRALEFPPEVRIETAVVASETEAFQARRRLLDEAIAVIRRSIALVDRELATAESMAAQGLMSEVEVMRLRRQRNELQMQAQERANRFRQDASTELLRVRTELAQLGEQQVAKADALQRTTLKSPLRGIVKNIRIGTLGGVVAAGAPILEIVPLTERVLIEARIKPADVGFVRTGLPAEVKLSAYDYYTYGGLKGTIEYLSPDAIGDERPNGAADNSYYRARIRTEAAKLQGKDGRPLAVLPGMTASVEIRTGDRTVMQFLLKPMFKGSEAFRER